MKLFQDSQTEFCGRFTEFWNGWWLALDLFLPDQDSQFIDDDCWPTDTPYEEDSVDEKDYGPDSDGILSIAYRFFVVYQVLLRFYSAQSQTIPLSFMRYAKLSRIPASIIRSLQDQNLEYRRWHIYGALSGHMTFSSTWDHVSKKKRVMEDRVIPYVAVGIIRCIDLGRNIPADVQQHLETEGLLKDVKLLPLRFKHLSEEMLSTCHGSLLQ